MHIFIHVLSLSRFKTMEFYYMYLPVSAFYFIILSTEIIFICVVSASAYD